MRAARISAARWLMPHSSAMSPAVVAPQLISLGVKAFWNFSHYDLALEYRDIVVENVHLSDSLMTLSYQLKNN